MGYFFQIVFEIFIEIFAVFSNNNFGNKSLFFLEYVFYYLMENPKSEQKTSKNRKTCSLYKSNVNLDE